MPRRPSTDCYDLIQTLTPAERGYVHKTLTRSLGREPQGMLALYEAMVASDRADSEPIQAVLKEVGGGASQLKRLLFDHLLRTLRTLDSARDPRVEVLALLQEGALLLERALIGAARERFEHAEARAAEQHAFTIQAEALQALMRIERMPGQPNDPAHVEALRVARTAALQCALDLSTLTHVSSTLFEATRSPDARTVAEQTLQHPLVATMTHQHPRLRFWQHHVRAMAFHVLDDEPSQDTSLSAMLSIMREHPVFLTEDAAITTLANILTTRLHRRDVPGSREALALVESIAPSSPRMKDDLWYNASRGRMYLLLLEGRDEELIDLRDRMYDAREEYPMNGEVVWRSWRLLAATAHMRRGEFDRSRSLAVSIIDERGLPEHQYTVPRLQELLCLLALGDMELVLYRARSIERVLRASGGENGIASALVRHMKGLARGGRAAVLAADSLRSLCTERPSVRADRTMMLTLQAESTIPRVIDHVMHMQGL